MAVGVTSLGLILIVENVLMDLFGTPTNEEGVGVVLGCDLEGDVEEFSLVEDFEVDPLVAESALHVLGLSQLIYMQRILNKRPIITELLIVIRKKERLNQQWGQRQLLIIHCYDRTLLHALSLSIPNRELFLLNPVDKHYVLCGANLFLLHLSLDVSHVLLGSFCPWKFDGGCFSWL